MKAKPTFLCAIFFVAGCSARAEISQGDLLKIASEHQPQSSNSVFITTNLAFFLTSREQHLFPINQFKSDDLIFYGILGTTTNYIGARHFPSGNFDFHLFDENGKEVGKTKSGIALTGTPPKPTEANITFYRTSGFSPFYTNEKVGEYHELFRPEDVFVITNKGIYDLEIQTRLCVIMTNGSPDLKAMTDWRNITSLGNKFYNDFGILTSPPLRVKIIKEKDGN